jgi:Ca2+-binding EF-hand superfamily protein
VKKALTDVQVGEIRKAFAMVDQDGSGSIDASELRNCKTLKCQEMFGTIADRAFPSVMRAIVGEDPSEADIQRM